MDIVFTQSDTSEEAKVSTSDFKAHFPNVNGNMMWKQFEAYIRQATAEHVIPLLGQTLYDDIASKISGNTVPANLAEFARQVQDVVAYYTMYYSIPKDLLVHSNFGPSESESSDGTSRPARQWVFYSTLWSIVAAADNMMDRLLLYMESNLNLESDYLQTKWADKEVYTAERDEIFRHSSELSRFVNINKSRRAYIRLLPHIRSALKRYINPILCKDQLDEIISGLKSGTISPELKSLIEMVKPVLANYSLYIGIPHIRVVFDGNGISVTTAGPSGPLTGTILAGKTGASDTAINAFREQALADAQTFRADLVQFLYDNADDYPLWKNSTCYEEDDESCLSVPGDGAGAIFL